MKFLVSFFTLLFTFNTFAIVDGEMVNDSEFNQSVALVYKKNNADEKGEIYCSGTLVGEKSILTVAHCLKMGANAFNTTVENFINHTWIYIGNSTNEEAMPFITPQIKVKAGHFHPLNDSFRSDLAILELKESVDVNSYLVEPVQIQAIEYDDINGRELIHVGYGQIENGGLKGNKRQMRLPINRFNGYNGLGIGVPREKGPGACHGDSGGSGYLVLDDGSLKFVGVEYSISNHPCGKSATYFIPITMKIIDWIKSLNLPMYY